MKSQAEKALYMMAYDLIMCRSNLGAQRTTGGKRIVYPEINLRALPRVVENLCKEYMNRAEGVHNV
jgi:hypothetical protein